VGSRANLESVEDRESLTSAGNLAQTVKLGAVPTELSRLPLNIHINIIHMKESG
jgi:hypothetical protein